MGSVPETVFDALLGADAICDDGWVAAMSAATGVPSASLTGVLAGERTTKGLPVGVADKLIRRIFTRDPGAAEAAADGDTRSTVAATLETLRTETAPSGPGTVEELLELLVTEASSEELRKVPLATKLTRVLAVVGDAVPVDAVDVPVGAAVAILTGAVADTFADMDSGARMTFDVTDDRRLLAAAVAVVVAFDDRRVAALLAALSGTPTEGGDRRRVGARCATVAALAHRNRHRNTDLSVPPETVREALGWLCTLDLTAALAVATSRTELFTLATRVAVWCHAAGVEWFGPDSISAAVGVTAPELAGLVDPDDSVVDLLAHAAINAKCVEIAVELCTAATNDGMTRRRLGHVDISKLPAISPAVAIACHGMVKRSGHLDVVERFVRCCADAWGHQWDPAEVCAALDGDPAFSRLLDKLLPVACTSRTALSATAPVYLVDRSCRSIPLSQWLGHAPTVERLCSAASGIGADRWAVLISLLGSFTGTIDELLELTWELAPAAT